ncbi:hypothetical protein [Oleiagrimonas soli]|uniref:Uncharacterized protein n=1 Tax=Oleiagrimonas soli TaxID=1543381 RepID=A0A099CX26_9GAMM|nr:hypothetical protein [Oleiagrimonas soli]KGI78241.1 hypothetical protein LF63_0107900 [Oleiagrimonas soli]MBB6183291.1 hypothetical protein [Oleiagrimonas soli]
MKALDGVIAVVGVAALALAGLTVYRAREASRVEPPMPMPSIHAPPPSASDFPSCSSTTDDMQRWRCEVDVARRQHRIRCYGQRLYYVTHDASGTTVYRPWPAALQCWNDNAASSTE